MTGADLPASVRGNEPPVPPQGLLNFPYGGAPGGQPMGPSPPPSGPPTELPGPEGADPSLFYSPDQMSATRMNEIQQYIRAGLLPSGISRDTQDPLLLPPGYQAHMRDPSGGFTGDTLQAPFAPDSGPQLSALDQSAVFAYASKNRIPIDELGPEEIMQAIAEGKEMMRKGENAPQLSATDRAAITAYASERNIQVNDMGPREVMEALSQGRDMLREEDRDRVIPIITMNSEGNPITAYRRESDVVNKAFPRPKGSEGQAANALDSARQIYPRLKELSVGIKGMGEWEGEGGIFTTEGWRALLSGAAKSARAKLNLDLDLAEYNSAVQGFIPTFARAVGHTGVLTELDVEKTRGLFPLPGDSRALALRKLKNIEMLMEGEARLAPDWWDPRGLALRPPPNPTLQGLTNEELLGFME